MIMLDFYNYYGELGAGVTAYSVFCFQLKQLAFGLF